LDSKKIIFQESGSARKMLGFQGFQDSCTPYLSLFNPHVIITSQDLTNLTADFTPVEKS